MAMTDLVLIPLDDMEREFSRILVKYGFDKPRAEECARVFAENSLDGIVTHGVNRFPRFIRYVIEDLHRSIPDGEGEVLYPGERVKRTRAENTLNGIPVDASIWGEVLIL